MTKKSRVAGGLIIVQHHVPNHLRLGEYHPAFAGHYLGLQRGEQDQPDYHLFRAPKSAEIGPIEYGDYRTLIDGTSNDRDGLANTLAHLKHNKAHPIAKHCRGLVIDGKADYYWPAREELRLARTNAPELFVKDAAYWSSTQNDEFYAWVQDFGRNGYQFINYRYNKFLVCPVRRELILR